MFLENRLERLVEKVRGSNPVPLRLRLWSGRSYELGPDPTVTVTVPKASALRYFVSPDLMKLGEAYVEGYIDLDGPVQEVFRVGERFARVASGSSALAPVKRAVRDTKGRDRKAIEYHYDVSNDFYELWLDRNMVYSCAYFKRAEDSLDAAQEQKLDHILTKLALRPGERLLDIGCAPWRSSVRARSASRYRRTSTTTSGARSRRGDSAIAARCGCRTTATSRRRAATTRSRASACSSTSA
jgi:cyclopropane-fatty-acyl-phospholipid synthase